MWTEGGREREVERERKYFLQTPVSPLLDNIVKNNTSAYWIVFESVNEWVPLWDYQLHCYLKAKRWTRYLQLSFLPRVLWFL